MQQVFTTHIASPSSKYNMKKVYIGIHKIRSEVNKATVAYLCSNKCPYECQVLLISKNNQYKYITTIYANK